MSRPALYAFNRGLVSPLALARVDIKRLALSSSVHTNWMPRVMGSMMLRPGLGIVGSTYSNNQPIYMPFIFSTTDAALIEITANVMRVWVDDALVTRASVSTAVTNANFETDVTGWTDADEVGATSSWVGGYLSLVGTDLVSAIRRQEVTCTGTDTNVRHALRVVIASGNVVFKVGSTSGGDEYVSETTLAPGIHSLAFTPTSNFFIEVSNSTQWAAYVDSITVESAGVMVITAPWTEDALSLIRWDQSADVVFVACEGYQQRRIERRAADSWSLVDYETSDGPFRTQNLTSATLTGSALNGDITLTASKNVFRDTHVGALFRMTSSGQTVSVTLTAENQWSSSIRVIGTAATRTFSLVISGTWVATITTQRSTDDEVTWVDYRTDTANVAGTSILDGLDNQIVFYRIGIDVGDYTSGTAVATLTFSAGSIDGIVRITDVASATSASASVLSSLGATTATSNWSEGEWSDYRGWPSAVAFHDGRLIWAGKDKFIASVSDAFDSFDDTTEGDSGPITRSIGSGPVDNVNWMLSLQRLLAGTAGAEISVRSSALDEPLTPTAFNPKRAGTQGAAKVAAVVIDNGGMFVQRSGVRLFSTEFNPSLNDYANGDMTAIIPEIGEPSITRVTVQRQPDTRVHCVRSDGTVAVLIYDRIEEVKAWIEIETDGEIEEVVVLPGALEDAVYYAVKRTINGAEVRYLEKWAQEGDCIGGTLNLQADAYITGTNSPASVTISGLSQLEGAEVICWADGIDYSPGVGDDQTTYTVTGGAITLGTAVTDWVVGLPYSATWQSTKLAHAVTTTSGGSGSTLGKNKNIHKIQLIMANTHPQGIEFGPDFDSMDGMPLTDGGALVDQDVIHTAYDEDVIAFPGTWDTDARLCLRATAPRPAAVMAAIIEVESY